MDKQETRVTVADAKAAALRLINSHFRNDDQARMHIPAREDDDDLLLMRFLNQQEVGEPSSKGHAELPAFPIEKLKARLQGMIGRPDYDQWVRPTAQLVLKIIAELEAEVKEGK